MYIFKYIGDYHMGRINLRYCQCPVLSEMDKKSPYFSFQDVKVWCKSESLISGKDGLLI